MAKYIYLETVLKIICDAKDKTEAITRLLYVSPSDVIEVGCDANKKEKKNG